jgi:NAD-dependent dihydropyrimidine dehydrogenase PreA subunit
MEKKLYVIPEQGISKPIMINPNLCIGCNRCIEVCQVDIFIPNPEKGNPPIIIFPGECWYCGCCVSECPKEGAIKLNPLLMNLVHWREKEQKNKT